MDSTVAEDHSVIENWTPEPLVPEINADEHQYVLNPRVVTSKPGKFITIDGCECLNLGTHNYLGLADDSRLEEASIRAAKKYGVGSCGPRAFYGTMDVHLDLEKATAEFLGVQEVALYSFGFSTIASAIPAYAKSTDVIFFDERCNFAIQRGIIVSKAQTVKFRHNDVEDLETKINEFHLERQKKYGKPKPIRAFLIIESIYAQTGSMCPLKKLVEIAKNHKIRLFMDESRSFGVLGKGGKGITQELNVDINDIDLIMVTLENALCGFGGFCAGSTYVVDHQRLAGTGYCFSASLPPLQCQVALESLSIIDKDPSLVSDAQGKFRYAHEKLEKLKYLRNISDPLSPVKILVIRRDKEPDSYFKEDQNKLDSICNKILERDSIAMTVARYLVEDELTSPLASIRLVVSACLTHTDIDRVFVALDSFFPVT